MILTDLQTYTPYHLDPTKSTFHSILAILLHAYDKFPLPHDAYWYTSLSRFITKHNAIP